MGRMLDNLAVFQFWGQMLRIVTVAVEIHGAASGEASTLQARNRNNRSPVGLSLGKDTQAIDLSLDNG